MLRSSGICTVILASFVHAAIAQGNAPRQMTATKTPPSAALIALQALSSGSTGVPSITVAQNGQLSVQNPLFSQSSAGDQLYNSIVTQDTSFTGSKATATTSQESGFTLTVPLGNRTTFSVPARASTAGQALASISCLRVTFSSDSPDSSLALLDFDAYQQQNLALSAAASGPASSFGSCSMTNCSSGQDFSVPSSIRIMPLVNNTGDTPANVSYMVTVLQACTGTGSISPTAAVPAFAPASAANSPSSAPTVNPQEFINAGAWGSNSTTAPDGLLVSSTIVTNASCLTAGLAVAPPNDYLFAATIGVMDVDALVSTYNVSGCFPATSACLDSFSLISHCVTGPHTSTCSFEVFGLNSSAAYAIVAWPMAAPIALSSGMSMANWTVPFTTAIAPLPAGSCVASSPLSGSLLANPSSAATATVRAAANARAGLLSTTSSAGFNLTQPSTPQTYITWWFPNIPATATPSFQLPSTQIAIWGSSSATTMNTLGASTFRTPRSPRQIGLAVGSFRGNGNSEFGPIMNSDSPYSLQQAFGFIGAACMTYSYASSGQANTFDVADLGALLDGYLLFEGGLSHCSAWDCTASKTISLNASAAQYYWQIAQQNKSWSFVDYQIRAPGDPACQNLPPPAKAPYTRQGLVSLNGAAPPPNLVALLQGLAQVGPASHSAVTGAQLIWGGFTNTTSFRVGVLAVRNITVTVTLYVVPASSAVQLVTATAPTFEYLASCQVNATSSLTCELHLTSLNTSTTYYVYTDCPADPSLQPTQLFQYGTVMQNPLDPAPAIFRSFAQPVVSATSHSSTGAIVGGIVGGIVGALLILAVALLLIWRRRKQQDLLASQNPWDNSQKVPFWNCCGRSTAGSSKTSHNVTSIDGGTINTTSDWMTEDFKPMAQPPLTAPARAPFAALQNRLVSQVMPGGHATTTLDMDDTAQRSTFTTEKLGIAEEVDSGLPEGLRDTWQIDLQDLQLDLDENGEPVQLGSGASGKVYKGNLGGYCPVAVKVVSSRDPAQQKRFVHEIATLRACHSPNIILFLGACIQQNNTVLVMQYMPNGNLWDALAKDAEGTLRWYKGGSKLALEIAAGVSYLHSRRIVHLDLKSPNVLLDEHKKAFVADIGLGKMLAEGMMSVPYGASIFWASPEQLQRQPCSTASDIYSLGVIIWEIITGAQPINRIMRPIRVPQEAPQPIADLIDDCLQRDPASRPSIADVFKTLKACA